MLLLYGLRPFGCRRGNTPTKDLVNDYKEQAEREF